MKRSETLDPVVTLDPVLERFTATVHVIVRPCTEADLAPLEWNGAFTPHRAIMARAFERQQRGQVLMLVAEVARVPAGQVWIDFATGGADAARIWALRVLPCLQGSGIGTRLLAAAERQIAARGRHVAELGCDKDNPRARCFYERRGYQPAYEQVEQVEYTTPGGEHIRATGDLWILQKLLG